MSKQELLKKLYALKENSTAYDAMVIVEQALMDSAIMPNEATGRMVNAVADERLRQIETGQHHDGAAVNFRREYKVLIATQQGE
jgi:hypothetical protein